MKGDYWLEAVDIAVNEAGVKATRSQIDEIAGSIEVSHENYGMAHGYDAIPNPLKSQHEQAIRDIEKTHAELLHDRDHKIRTLNHRIKILEGQLWNERSNRR